MPAIAVDLGTLLDAFASYDGFICPGCGCARDSPAEIGQWPEVLGRRRFLLCDVCAERREESSAFRAELGLKLLDLP